MKILPYQLKQKTQGFTLVELIVSLLVISLLLAWGIPNYRNLKTSRDVIETANEMVYSFSLAKAEAVRRGQDVDVVSGNWQNGWSLRAGAEIIANQQAIDPQIIITQLGPNLGNFAFTNIGAVAGGGTVNFSVTHAGDATLQRNIVIGPSGSTRVIEP